MKISSNFDLKELIYSPTAAKYNISNFPTEKHLNILKHTCENCLEQIRFLLNKNFINVKYNGKIIKKAIIIVTSGYRSQKLNSFLKKLGYKPSETSQHCSGEAADIKAKFILNDGSIAELPYSDLYLLIKSWVKKDLLSVDQCIKEKQGSSTWVHVSYSAWGKLGNRNKFLIFNGKKYIAD